MCLLFEIFPFNFGVEWMMSLRFEIMSLEFVNALFLFSVCSINGKTFFHRKNSPSSKLEYSLIYTHFLLMKEHPHIKVNSPRNSYWFWTLVKHLVIKQCMPCKIITAIITRIFKQYRRWENLLLLNVTSILNPI